MVINGDVFYFFPGRWPWDWPIANTAAFNASHTVSKEHVIMVHDNKALPRPSDWHSCVLVICWPDWGLSSRSQWHNVASSRPKWFQVAKPERSSVRLPRAQNRLLAYQCSLFLLILEANQSNKLFAVTTNARQLFLNLRRFWFLSVEARNVNLVQRELQMQIAKPLINKDSACSYNNNSRWRTPINRIYIKNQVPRSFPLCIPTWKRGMRNASATRRLWL